MSNATDAGVAAHERLDGDSRPGPTAQLPWRTRMAIYSRMFAVQGSWNYDLLVGTGIAFSVEPALRFLPGGRGGEAYRAAVARESRYFNAHPYLTSLAVGALARAELDREEPARIERFRTALCGPLGSVGDRLVWAGWLPFCSLTALAAASLGLRPAESVALFLILYNAGHLALRAWGLGAGWRGGLRVATALGTPLLRHGPAWVARGVALVGGLVLPLALNRMLVAGPMRASTAGASLGWPGLFPPALSAAVLGTILLVRLPARVEGWRATLLVLAVLALFTITWP